MPFGPSDAAKPFAGGRYDLLSAFSHEAWGHSERFLNKGTLPDAGDVEFVDLGEYLPSVRFCFCGTHFDRILVRDEYRVALEALQQPKDAYVTGQPGIGRYCIFELELDADSISPGKTLFLVYLLVYFLGHKNAVAVQLPETAPRYAFFTDKGVTIHSECESGPMDHYPGDMWALCDSNQTTRNPSCVFSHSQGRMRVIQTTPPESSRWKGWSKQTGARRYIMDIWSLKEIKTLA